MAVLTEEEKRYWLARVPLFAGLDARELHALAPTARSLTFRARQEVFHKGDAAGQLYVVVRGRLKALTTSAGGDDVVFSIMGPGEVFGEIGLLSERPRTATVRAIERSEVLALDRRELLAFLRGNPDAAIRLMGVLAERLARVSELVEDTQFLNLPVRLAKKLLAFAGRYGRDEDDGALRIDLKLSQEEWGDLVGATRESINKQMRAWGEEGLVRVDGGYVVLLRRGALERLAGATLD